MNTLDGEELQPLVTDTLHVALYRVRGEERMQGSEFRVQSVGVQGSGFKCIGCEREGGGEGEGKLGCRVGVRVQGAVG